jgi:hypothetical protein
MPSRLAPESHVGETVRLDSDLIFYANDHQGHVVPLRGAVGKGGDLIQDAFYDCAGLRSQQERSRFSSPSIPHNSSSGLSASVIPPASLRPEPCGCHHISQRRPAPKRAMYQSVECWKSQFSFGGFSARSFTPWVSVTRRGVAWGSCPYRLIAMIIGTVTTNDNVERSSADADSASMALYLAASRTTIVARGKLQQTSASRANGLCT